MRDVTFATTVLAASLLASTSYAADMPAKMPVKAPPPAAGYSWTGFYVGVNGGYGVGRDPTTLTNFTNPPPGAQQLADSWNLSPAGVIGGVQAGYNYQIERWVLGIEADFQGSNQKDSVCLLCAAATGFFNVDQKMPWFATVRGRVGWAAGPILSYVTGGWAYARVQNDLSIALPGFPTTSASSQENKSGWTIGTGVEAALGGNWTAKVEYLYMSLGSTTVPFLTSGTGNSRTSIDSDIRDRLIRLGLNYRIGPTTGTGSATAPAPAFLNWAGFYLGGNGGYGVGRDSSNLSVNFIGVQIDNDQWKESPGGYFGGVQAGYAWQTANFVYGLEADIQGGNLKDSACLSLCGGTFTEVVDQKISWFGTARGRLGYAAGPALFYVTGGLAFGDVKTTLTETTTLPSNAALSVSDTKTGWTIGGGAETALWGNWTAKTEYLYMDLGSTSLSLTNTVPGIGTITHTLNSDIRAHIFRGGVNYHF